MQLTYVSPTSAERQQMEGELFGDVQKSLPHVTVSVAGAGTWEQTKEKSLVSHAAGTPVHVAQAGWGTWLDMWSQGTIVELSALFKRDKIDPGETFIVFATGKVGMQVQLVTEAALPFKWSVATMPYSGPTGSKNVSGRIHNHALLMGKTKPAEQEATWQLFRWLLTPENAGRFPRAAGHVVSPLKLAAASDVSQRRYREQLGVDPGAYLLQAQTTRPSGWGMAKYANFSGVGPEIDARYLNEFMADKLGVREYATWVTKHVDDTLGAK